MTSFWIVETVALTVTFYFVACFAPLNSAGSFFKKAIELAAYFAVVFVAVNIAIGLYFLDKYRWGG